MRVLQVHNRYRSSSPGGEDRVVDQERAALSEHGHVVSAFERRNDDIDEYSRMRRAMVAGQAVWSGSARRELRAAIDAFQPDVVHIHNTFPLLSPSVLYACRDRDVPSVVTLHNYRLACAPGDFFRDGHPCHDCLGRPPLPAVRHGCYHSRAESIPVTLSSTLHTRAWQSLPSAFVFLSASQREILAPLRLPADRAFVKPNLIPPDVVQPVAVREPLITYAGRLAPAKGIPLLMRAWDRYVASGQTGLRLVIAGSGPLGDEVTAWTARHSSVEAPGMLDRASCAALVARSRAVIVPSQWQETFGLVAIEAMACGVPPIAPAHGSFPELVRNGRDGVLFEPGSADALARVFQEADDQPELFDEYGRNARSTYLERFDPDANVEQLLDIYRFAITNPRIVAARNTFASELGSRRRVSPIDMSADRN